MISAGGKAKPNLPTKEQGGIYDLDPMLLNAEGGWLMAHSADPRLKQVGPWHYQPWKLKQDFADVSIPPVVVPEP